MIARSRLVANFLSHCAMHRQLTRVIGLNQSVRLQSTNDNPDENITLKLPPNATGISVKHSNANSNRISTSLLNVAMQSEVDDPIIPEKSLDGTSLRSNKSAPESEQSYKQLQNLESKNENLRELKVELNRSSQRDYEIFVGGLSEKISQDTLRTYFSQFGEVVKCSLFGESGYVTFNSSRDVSHVLVIRPFYIIGNRITNAELIVWMQKFRREDYGLRELKAMRNPADDRTILVNGLSAEISKDAFLAYLSRFGDVELCQIPFGDQSAYVTFKSQIAVIRMINDTFHPHYIIADRITNKIPLEQKEDDETQRSDISKNFLRGVEFTQSKSCDTDTKDQSQLLEVIRLLEDFKLTRLQTNEKMIMVRGLSKEISRDALRTYFSQFGGIVECFSFGKFGYVIFGSSREVNLVMDRKPHYLGKPKKDAPFLDDDNESDDCTDEVDSDDDDLVKIFSNFGQLTDWGLKSDGSYGWVSFARPVNVRTFEDKSPTMFGKKLDIEIFDG